MEKTFQLNGQAHIELCNLLKLIGACQTGGHAKIVISESQVLVDGQIELRKRCKIKVGQTVTFEDYTIKVLE